MASLSRRGGCGPFCSLCVVEVDMRKRGVEFQIREIELPVDQYGLDQEGIRVSIT